jgi:exopolysaccharide production protein ExoQ
MVASIATILFVIGIGFLFWADRDPQGRLSRVLWLPLLSLLISGSRPLTLWLPSQKSISADQFIEGSPIDAAVALALIIAGIVVLARRHKQIAKVVRANPVVVLFILYCLVSVSWSDFPGVALKRWVRLTGDFVTILILLTDRDPARAVKWVLTRVAFVLIPVSVLLIKYYPNLARYYDSWTGQQYVSGVSMDKNMLGMMCLVYGSAVLFRFLELWRERKSSGRTQRLVGYGAVLMMLFWLLSLAHSMTSLSCFCFATVLIVVTGLIKAARKPLVVHLMVAGILGVTFGILFLHIGEGAALEQLGRNPTLTGRTEIWSALLGFAGNPIFGTGYESFWLGDRLKNIWASGSLLGGVNEAHNGYLETYLNLGWIGVALLVAFIVLGYRNVIATMRRGADFGRLKLAFFVVAVAYNFTEAGFRAESSVWFAFLIAAIGVPLTPVLKRSRYVESDDAREANSIAPALARLPDVEVAERFVGTITNRHLASQGQQYARA